MRLPPGLHPGSHLGAYSAPQTPSWRRLGHTCAPLLTFLDPPLIVQRKHLTIINNCVFYFPSTWSQMTHNSRLHSCLDATVSTIISDTCQALWEALGLQTCHPSTKQWKNIADDFFTLWNCLNCVRSIENMHIIIQVPKNAGSQFCNYKDMPQHLTNGCVTPDTISNCLT